MLNMHTNVNVNSKKDFNKTNVIYYVPIFYTYDWCKRYVTVDDLTLSIVNAKNEEMGVLNFEKKEIKKAGQVLIDQYEDLNGVLKAFIKKDWIEIQHDDELINK